MGVFLHTHAHTHTERHAEPVFKTSLSSDNDPDLDRPGAFQVSGTIVGHRINVLEVREVIGSVKTESCLV
jgi:hypothetical protein